MVMHALIDQNTNRPINLLTISPAMINALSRLVLTVNKEERMDMEDFPERSHTSGTRNMPQHDTQSSVESMRVLGPEALADAKSQLMVVIDRLSADE
jgi:hypothetical protein